MATLPYETSTAGDKALIELQRTLQKFDCQSFGTMIDAERGCTIVAFKWRDRNISLEASWKGYAQAWSKRHPLKGGYGRGSLTRAEYDRRALEQARMSVCSVLRDWVKGQVTAIECGVMSFEAAFMPHILLPNGMRLIDHVQAENLLPAPPAEKVVKISDAR